MATHPMQRDVKCPKTETGAVSARDLTYRKALTPRSHRTQCAVKRGQSTPQPRRQTMRILVVTALVLLTGCAGVTPVGQ